MNTIQYTIPGPIPEKNFVLKRKNGEIKQSDEAKEWEYNIKKLLKGAVKGWTSQTDLEYGEYTPLQMLVTIYTPYKTTMIKQLKTLLDALTGAVYMDDCTVVDLLAERRFSQSEYTEITVRPANKDYIKLPDEKAVIIDRYLKPIKNTAWDMDTKCPLDRKAYKSDKEYKTYIRQCFDQQQEDLIVGDFDMFAVIGASELKIRTPLNTRVAAYNMDTFPITTPDADNCIYAILSALNQWEINDPQDLVKLHIVKTYYNPSCSRNRIWLTNHRSTDDIITIGDNFS